MPSLVQVRQYWYTVRFLRPRQMAARVQLRARAAWRRRRPAQAEARYRRRAAQAELAWPADPWGLIGAADAARALLGVEARARLDAEAHDAIAGRFTFLNEPASGSGGRLDWTAAAQTQLWRYHLHYFDYLPDAVIAGLPWETLQPILADWIAHNPLGPAGTRDAWHPYVVSLRLVNWMLAAAAAPRGTAVGGDVEAALRAQIVFVERNLEIDVGGNHLLKNLKALAIAGCFWAGAGADRLRARFVPAFVAELAHQLRSDGGHYEQSPMYHEQVLVDAAEVAMALRLAGRDVPDPLDACLARMQAFLDQVCHPDGQIAQFGDSAFNMTPPPAQVGAAVRLGRGLPTDGPLAPRHALAATRLRHGAAGGAGAAASDPAAPAPRAARSGASAWDPQASGVVVLASDDRRFHLVADAGPVCPDDLPAHAHSDLFGFEVSVDGVRLIVDTGVSEYRAGAWRSFERSTRAHSTVLVDGREQSECWSSFRVAERAHVVAGRRFTGADARGFAARHDGYERLPQPVRHTRQFAFLGERAWVVVDALDGAGRHRWETFLHAHPEVTLREHPDGGWLLERGAARLRALAFGVHDGRVVRGSLEPLQGWYAPEFGLRLPAPVLTFGGAGPLPATFGWLLVPDPAPGPLGVEVGPDRLVRVELGGERFTVPFAPPG